MSEIQTRMRQLASESGYSDMPDVFFLVEVSRCLRTNTHIDEREVIPLSSTERRVFVAAASDVMFTKHVIPRWMRHGTEYVPITNLKDGMAHPRKEGGGYLSLESFASIAKAAENKDDLDAQSWLSLIGDKIYTPRTIDIHDSMMVAILANLWKRQPSLYFQEALAIYRALKDKTYAPWTISKLRGRLLSSNAKAAPVMMAAYFQDMIWMDHKHAIGMIPDYMFPQSEVLALRREMLQRGYFDSILATKKIKDVMVKLCGEGNEFVTVQSTEAGAIHGLAKKKCLNKLDVEDDVMETLVTWPRLLRMVKKESDTINLTQRLVGLMHVTSSANFIWTDSPIVATRSQFSKISEVFVPPKPKLVDELTGHIYEYHDGVEDIYQVIANYFKECPCPQDLNSSFIRDLTSNSAGTIPLSIEEEIKALPQVLQSLARSKVGLVALFGKILNDRDQIESQLAAPTKILFRDQIQRRPRMVSGVDVVKQLSAHVGKRLSKFVYRKNDTFVSGKTDNSASDALLQLRGTGAPRSVNIYSDVPGFDASDQLPLQEYIRSKYMGPVKLYDVMNKSSGYFAIPPTSRVVLEYDLDHNLVRREVMDISSPWECWRMSTEHTPLNVVKDPKGRKIDLSHSTLASGLFDTTIQAGAVTGAVGIALKNKFPLKEVATKNSGDDFVASFESEDFDKDADDLGSYIREQMAAVGFSTENNFSTIFSEFLQIGALCGQVLSYGHRLSPFTAERYDERHPLDMYGSTIGIFQEELGRCHFPDELTRRMHTFCYVASNLRASSKCTDSTARKTKTGVHIKVPQVGMYMRYNVPFPAFEGDTPSSSYTFGGDAKLFELFTSVFGLRTVEQASRDDMRAIAEISERIKAKHYDELEHFDVFNAIIEKQRQMIRDGVFDKMTLKRMNVEKAAHIDLRRSLVYRKINVSIAPDRSTFDEVELGILEKAAGDVNRMMDASKINRSAVAAADLSALGIAIPDRLIYARQNFHKLVNVYASHLKRDKYWQRMDAHVDSEFSRLVRKKMTDLFDGLLAVFDIGVTLIPGSNVLDLGVASTFRKTAPAPFTMMSEDGRLAMARAGTSGTTDNSISVLDRAVDFDYLANNTAAWETIIQKLSSLENPEDGIALVATAVGLDEKEMGVLQDLVLSNQTSPGGLLHITANKRARFRISDDGVATISRTSDAIDKLTGEHRAVSRTGMALALMLEGAYGSAAGAERFEIYFPGVWAGVTMRKALVLR